jgi:SulP family sulfate permease
VGLVLAIAIVISPARRASRHDLGGNSGSRGRRDDAGADHGLDYLFAATILMGLIQIVAGLLRLGLLMRFVSRSVITGFVNALAILIFMAQIPQLVNVSWHTYAMIAAGLAIIYLLPRLTTAVPSPLVAIVVLAAVSIGFGLPVNTVGDMGKLPEACRASPAAAGAAHLGDSADHPALLGDHGGRRLARIDADRADRRRHDRHRPATSAASASARAGPTSPPASSAAWRGCAMIGQSVINVKSGGRGASRPSSPAPGCSSCWMVLVGDWVAASRWPALVAVMIMVSIGTFSWNSIPNLRAIRPSSSVVMLVTVCVVVFTHDLAQGVLAGVLLSGIFFAGKVRRMFSVERTESDGAVTYTIGGEIFFASVDRFTRAFQPEAGRPVTIDVSPAHFWDISGVGALDKIVARLRRDGSEVKVIGYNKASADLVDPLRPARQDRRRAGRGASLRMLHHDGGRLR